MHLAGQGFFPQAAFHLLGSQWGRGPAQETCGNVRDMCAQGTHGAGTEAEAGRPLRWAPHWVTHIVTNCSSRPPPPALAGEPVALPSSVFLLHMASSSRAEDNRVDPCSRVPSVHPPGWACYATARVRPGSASRFPRVVGNTIQGAGESRLLVFQTGG